jgi:hypothetical protein
MIRALKFPPTMPTPLLQDMDLFAARKAATIDQIRPKDRFIPFASCTDRNSSSSRSSTPNSSSSSAAKQPATGLARSQQAGGSGDQRYVFKEPPMPLPPCANSHTKLLSLQVCFSIHLPAVLRSRSIFVRIRLLLVKNPAPAPAPALSIFLIKLIKILRFS